MAKQIQYFRTDDKTDRTSNYTLWLDEGKGKGKLTFSKRDQPGDIWEPPSTMKAYDSNDPILITEEGADRLLFPSGFTHKEVTSE